jgi:BMFP domain-containing protein YqiC
MSMPKDEVQKEMVDAWRIYLEALEQSMNKLDADIKEAAEMADQCTSEWCEATQHVIDELGNSLFAISEPRWANEEDSNRIRALKRRVHDLYANYREVYRQVA